MKITPYSSDQQTILQSTDHSPHSQCAKSRMSSVKVTGPMKRALNARVIKINISTWCQIFKMSSLPHIAQLSEDICGDFCDGTK